MRTVTSTSDGKLLQKEDWVSFNGTDYTITKIEDATSFSIKPVRWYHRLWRWLKSDF